MRAECNMVRIEMREPYIIVEVYEYMRLLSTAISEFRSKNVFERVTLITLVI